MIKTKHTILWADDEIDLLKPHVMFLQSKGYEIVTVNNGADAIEIAASRSLDLIILDENMPGLTGLETLRRIKLANRDIPIVMITKSEEENLMDQAVGSKIADYLIKPVNPNQILLSIKKTLHSSELVSENSSLSYQQSFSAIARRVESTESIRDWMEVYRILVHWEMELADADGTISQMLETQKMEANAAFFRFISKNYESWMDPECPGRPLMSPDLFRDRVLPALDNNEKLMIVVIDNFRLDQWRAICPLLNEFFTVEEDALYCSILPTATQYARNAIFSGLMPLDMERLYPRLWVGEESAEGKNMNEEQFIRLQLGRFRRNCGLSYNKINDSASGERFLRDFPVLDNGGLNIVVMNFVDMLSHARTESKMVRELAPTDAAYRSLTESWFRHSSAIDIFRLSSKKGYKLVLTTDHGTIRVRTPQKVTGERTTNTNLRYKLGRNLSYNPRAVYEMTSPRKFGLPSPNLSTSYIFAAGNDFFAYPNNYNHYVQYYTDTFQHGGISMEEMLVPLITLLPRK